MRTRSRLAIGLLALAALLAPGRPDAQTKFVVAIPHPVLFDTALPLYVAEEKGFYKEAGLAVERVVVSGGGENVQAVVSGSVHLATATGAFAVLSAFEKGAPVRIVSAEMTGTPDLYWYVPKGSPVQRLDDLAGKKVAFSNPGSSTHMAVLAMIEQLRAKGLTPPQAVSTGSPPDTLTAVKTGQVDAGWAAVPFALDQVEKGDLRIVVKGAEITRLGDVTIRVNFTSVDVLQKQGPAVRGFLRAHQRALDFIFAERVEAVRIWIKNGLKLSEPAAMKAFDFHAPGPLALKPVKGLAATMEDAVRFKFLKAPLAQADVDRLVDLSLLP
jgi:NitT/TauT family transport system substrate-binding protein